MSVPNHLLVCGALLLSCPAFAASNEDITAKLKAREFAAAENLARERIKANAQDEQAYDLLAAAALGGDATMREDAIPVLTACTEKLPASSICQHRLGQLYGVAAMQGGMLAAIRHGGKIKGLLDRAVELDPRNFAARRDLVQYYLQAPGVVGGSVARAEEHAGAHGKLHQVQGKLIEIDILLHRKDWDGAQRVLAGLPSGIDAMTLGAVRSAAAAVGFALINAKQYAAAQRLFEQAARETPDVALAHFGLGRALLESNQLDAAIDTLERAVRLDPAMGAQYRLGIAYQLKGDHQKAIANLEQFVDARPRRTGNAVDDARQRLAKLKKSA